MNNCSQQFNKVDEYGLHGGMASGQSLQWLQEMESCGPGSVNYRTKLEHAVSELAPLIELTI